MKLLTPITDIIIESPKRFEQTIKGFEEVAPFPQYHIKHSVISDGDKFTKNANTCTILGMSNGKDTFLGHFAPELKTSDFKDKLDYIVKKFQDKTGQLTAVITGGFDHEMLIPIKRQATESFEQLAEVGEIVDKNNAILTMIGGKKTPLFMDNLAVTKEKFILSHTPKKIGFEPMKDYKDGTDLENFLSEKYSISEIDPQHTLNYIG